MGQPHTPAAIFKACSQLSFSPRLMTTEIKPIVFHGHKFHWRLRAVHPFFPISPSHCLAQSLMSNLSSPETTTITTFSSPRSAPHPRVIPLFSSTVSRRCFGQPSIHKELRSKPLFHPYPTTKRPTPLNVVDSSSSGDAPAPSSPLTPMTDEHPHERTESSIPILTPPPPGTLTVASLKLPTATSRDYRVS